MGERSMVGMPRGVTLPDGRDVGGYSLRKYADEREKTDWRGEEGIRVTLDDGFPARLQRGRGDDVEAVFVDGVSQSTNSLQAIWTRDIVIPAKVIDTITQALLLNPSRSISTQQGVQGTLFDFSDFEEAATAKDKTMQADILGGKV